MTCKDYNMPLCYHCKKNDPKIIQCSIPLWDEWFHRFRREFTIIQILDIITNTIFSIRSIEIEDQLWMSCYLKLNHKSLYKKYQAYYLLK